MPSKHSGKSFLDSDSEEDEKPKKKASFLDSDEEEEEEQKAPKKKVSFLDDDDEEEEEEQKAPKKKASFLDDDDEEEEDDEEAEGGNVHGYAVSDKKKKNLSSSFLDSDEDEENEDIPDTFLSSSEEEGEDDDEGDDDDDDDDDGYDGGSSWFRSGGGDDDDDDSEESRRVKTQAQKCYDELDRVYEQISQHSFEVNCQSVFNDFEALQKVYQKYDGVQGVVYPPKLYLYALLEVENFISDTEADSESKRIAGSGLFLKLKNKFNKAYSPYEAQLKQYREDLQSGKEEGKPLYDPETCSTTPEPTESEEKEQEESGSEKVLTQEDIGKEIAEMYKENGKKEFKILEAANRLNILADKAIAPQLKLFANVMRLKLLNSHYRSMVPPPPFMPVAFWKQQVSTLDTIFDLCEKNANINVVESGEDSYEVIIQEALDTALPKEELEKRQAAKKDQGPSNYIVAYNLYLVLELLDDELVKSLRKLDLHKFEYLSRVKDELDFVDTYRSALKFYQRQNDSVNEAKVAAQLIQHVYFRIEDPADNGELTKDVAEWTKIVLKQGDERMKMRSVLAQIYQHAINDRFFEARDLLLKTHLQDVISHTDISTQILFNRTMAQLGLSAFRGGMLQEARACLFDIYNSQNQREMIGQSLSKNHDNTGEEEQRLVPHHMRINPDLIEVAVLVSMMLEEIPAFVANPRRKEPAQARPFWRYYHIPQNTDVNGPPQSTREHIIAAARCLQVGDWRGCFAMIEDLGVWKLMHERTSKMLQDKLKQLIKEESLRTTLFAHSAYFQSIKISELVEMYEMSEEQVRSIICHMILTNDLHASIDQPTGTLVPLHQEPTKLQILSQQLVEKTNTFVDGSERALDSRTNCYGFNKTDKNAPGEQVATGGIWSRQPQQKKQQQAPQQQQGRRMQQMGKNRQAQMQRSSNGSGRDHRRH